MSCPLYRTSYAVFMLLLILALIPLTGCASNSINLLKNQTISLEQPDTSTSRSTGDRTSGDRNSRVRFTGVAVFQEEGVLHISGHVRRRASFRGPISGYIELAIIDPHGKELAREQVRYTPRFIPTHPPRQSHFTLWLPLTPPQGSTLRLKHHTRPSDPP